MRRRPFRWRCSFSFSIHSNYGRLIPVPRTLCQMIDGVRFEWWTEHNGCGVAIGAAAVVVLNQPFDQCGFPLVHSAPPVRVNRCRSQPPKQWLIAQQGNRVLMRGSIEYYSILISVCLNAAVRAFLRHRQTECRLESCHLKFTRAMLPPIHWITWIDLRPPSNYEACFRSIRQATDVWRVLCFIVDPVLVTRKACINICLLLFFVYLYLYINSPRLCDQFIRMRTTAHKSTVNNALFFITFIKWFVLLHEPYAFTTGAERSASFAGSVYCKFLN